MDRQSDTAHTATHSSPSVTTTLACGWGLAASYTLFDGLLVRHVGPASLASLLPLLAVWATLERKRWGRLALFGMSVVTPVVFTALLFFLSLRMPPPDRDIALRTALRLAVDPYGSLNVAMVLLLLSVTTGLWLRHPSVIAEFDRGKRALLARAQHQIAAFLVLAWGLLIAVPPLLAASRLTAPVPVGARSTVAQRNAVSSRIRRSAAADSNP